MNNKEKIKEIILNVINSDDITNKEEIVSKLVEVYKIFESIEKEVVSSPTDQAKVKTFTPVDVNVNFGILN